MKRYIIAVFIAFAAYVPSTAQSSDAERLNGVWEITALIDDGVIVPDDIVRNKFARDGRFTISGSTIQFINPMNLQQRSLLFVIDPKTNPKTMDIAGGEKINGKGIYLLSDDTLMICIGEPEAPDRPVEFAARQGSPYLLMTLKRVNPVAVKPLPPLPPPVVVTKDDELRSALIGRWGHQDEDYVSIYSLNPDGTFSVTHTYKKKFGKLFHENVRSSGVWKVQDGVVFSTVTASTDRERINQVASYRVRTITPTDVIYVDQYSRLRREWRTQ